MKDEIISNGRPKIGVTRAPLAIGMALVTLLLLASLHFLSPEFDPSFRMVSEYALGSEALSVGVPAGFAGIGDNV